MQFDRGAIDRRTGHGDFELARQPGEFRHQCRPLPQPFAHRSWVDDFIGSDASERIGGDIAYAVPTGLYRVHLYAGQFIENVRHIDQLWPVELNVLARGEVSVAAIVFIRDVGKFVQLVGG